MRCKILLLCVIQAVILFPFSHSMAIGSGSKSGSASGPCENCPRTSTGKPVFDDLYHLEHHDPCSNILEIYPDVRKQSANSRCQTLVQLYLESHLYNGGRGSKCEKAEPYGCVQSGGTWDTHNKCLVKIPGRWFSSYQYLSYCVKKDHEWYITRTRVYGASYSLAEVPRAAPQVKRVVGAKHGTEETPKPDPKIERPQRKERGRSASPPPSSTRSDRGRTTERQAFGLFGFGKSTIRRTKSNSPTRPLLCDFTGGD